MGRSRVCVLLALLAGSLAAQTLDPTHGIDASQGVIEGKTAISFWPVEGFVDPVQPSDLLPPSGMEVRLVPGDNLDEETSHPCGKWLSPPPGKYKYWLEGRGVMSPASSVMTYSASPFEGSGSVLIRSVVPAGTIGVAPDRKISSGLILRLLHTESHNRGARPKSEMSRSVPADEAHTGVLMPEGPVVAGLFDLAKKEYVAISEPVDVFRDSVTYVDPRPPVAGTDLIAVLDRPGRVGSFEQYDISLSAVGPDGSSHPPELSIPTSDRIFAFWYGLRDKYITVRVESPSVFMEPQEIVLPEGKVARYHGQLRPLPDLEVRVHLPPGLAVTDESRLEVTTVPGRDQVAARKMVPGKDGYRFSKVPAEKLEAVLNMTPWYYSQRVDLSDGSSKTVVFEPSAYRITGTVFKGDEGAAATVTFDMLRGKDYQLSVDTDEAGNYETTLFRAGSFAALVKLAGAAGNPHLEILEQQIEGDTVVDFHLPDNHFEVWVVDAETGRGISDARVVVGNSYSKGGRSTSSATTGDDGRVRLRPLLAGEVSCWAEADGYLSSDQIVLPVGDVPERREIKIALRSVGHADSLLVLLPSGAPAVGAELLVVESLEDAPPLWQGQADGEGLVEIPRTLEGGFLLVRHPQASSAVHPWPSGGSEPDSLTLPPPAPPLSIQLMRPWGEPAAWARLAIWIDGRRIAKSALRWLTRSNGVDGEGFWRARHLPPVAVKVLAWKSGSDGELANHLESMASVVPFPWSGTVEIETIE